MPVSSRASVRAARSCTRFVRSGSTKPRAGWRIWPPVGTPASNGSNDSPKRTKRTNRTRSGKRFPGDDPEKRYVDAVLVLRDFVGADDFEACLNQEALVGWGVMATKEHRCSEPIFLDRARVVAGAKRCYQET